MTHDDMTPWQDTPLVHALTSDGTPAELDGEGAALAAFQSAMPRRRRRGVVRLVGTGATSVALLAVASGGVAAAAAAYTQSLPDPVQNFAHDVLGPIGVPAPAKHHKPSNDNHAGTSASTGTLIPTSSSSPSPGQTLSPSPTSGPHGTPSASQQAAGVPVASVSPSTSVSPTLSASPSATPTATPTATATASPSEPAGDPSTWSVSAAASRQIVLVHHGVRITGTLLDAAGQPVADRRVVVRVHDAGVSGWQRAAVRRTDSSGSIQAWLPDLSQNTVVMLGAGHGVHSAPVRIVVRPVLSVSSTPSSDGTSYVVTVKADGGDPGDVIDLLKHTASGWEQVGAATLDDSKTATFSVPAPKRQRGYVLRLPATKIHGESATRIVLQPLG